MKQSRLGQKFYLQIVFLCLALAVFKETTVAIVPEKALPLETPPHAIQRPSSSGLSSLPVVLRPPDNIEPREPLPQYEILLDSPSAEKQVMARIMMAAALPEKPAESKPVKKVQANQKKGGVEATKPKEMPPAKKTGTAVLVKKTVSDKKEAASNVQAQKKPPVKKESAHNPVAKPTPSKTTLEEQSLSVWEQKQKSPVSQLSIPWDKMVLSMLLVLCLVLLFIKLLLPKLLVSFPGLFSGNKDRSDDYYRKNRNAHVRAFGSRQKETQLPLLEQLQLNGERFQIRSTIPLSQDKELFLVDIQDRQLVIAATPYNISLICDLSEHPTTDLENLIQSLRTSGVQGLLSHEEMVSQQRKTGVTDVEGISARKSRFMAASRTSENKVLKNNSSFHKNVYKKYLKKNSELSSNVDFVFLDDYDDSYQES